ncbi:DHA2 family multidrug resistance protein-like MFS transporter [Kitasatospora sp. MAP12-15]|uniref:MFS transporter n=1 Tax=unclassified Kitasatospora TaxID=2633591 RepID=UPI002474F88D|nr:MFS transporter [Kitasatospora sp. MAP12-44]MDH6111280.1 DHA2 family multidrug resistance protein-like MFS transporter [Kitasatospora sp. MAP12-44]
MTATTGLAGRRAWIGLAVLLLPTLVLAMDMGVLFFAVPFISTDLRPSGTQQLWIMDSYSFLLAGLLIPMGDLGDRIGRRRLLLLGAAGFAGASLLAAYADGAAQLIAARALLGVAGATLMPSTLALIRNMFPDPDQRRLALGAWTGAMTGGATLGPVVGGLMLAHFWWGSAFLVSIPVMVLLLLAGPFLLPEYRSPQRGGFDLLGAGLLMAAVLPVVYGIKTLAVDGWSTDPALVLAAGLGFGALFVQRQRSAAHPLIELSLFRIRTYSGAITVNTVAMFAMMGFTLFTSQYLQLVKGMSPLTASLWALVPSVGVGAAVGLSGALAGKVRPGRQMAGGLLIGATGFALMTLVGPDSPLALVLTAAGVLAAGTVGTMMLTADLVVSAAPPERAGVAAATSETATELGSSLGIAILGAAGAAVYRARLNGALPAGLPGDAARAAHDTLGGAVTVAAHLPGAARGELLAATRAAFTDGMHLAAVVGLLFMIAAAVAANRLMGHLPTTANAGAKDTGDRDLSATQATVV